MESIAIKKLILKYNRKKLMGLNHLILVEKQ